MDWVTILSHIITHMVHRCEGRKLHFIKSLLVFFNPSNPVLYANEAKTIAHQNFRNFRTKPSPPNERKTLHFLQRILGAYASLVM